MARNRSHGHPVLDAFVKMINESGDVCEISCAVADDGRMAVGAMFDGDQHWMLPGEARIIATIIEDALPQAADKGQIYIMSCSIMGLRAAAEKAEEQESIQ